MPRGIEHREPGTLLDSYDNYGTHKWAIYCGTEQAICYDGEDANEARTRLENQLEAIKESGTNNQYSLRVYPDDVNDITSKTKTFKGSTTFMFGGQPTKMGENGVLVIDREARSNNYTGNPVLQSQISLMQKQLDDERELRHQAELNNLKIDFKNQIAGLADKDSVEDKLLTIGQSIIDKPEIITKIFEGLTTFFQPLFNKQPVVTEQPPVITYPKPVMSGTTQTADTMENENDLQEDILQEHDAVLDDDDDDDDEELTPEQQAIEDRIDNALILLYSKLGADKTVDALEKLSQMSPKKLGNLISMMSIV